CATIYTPPAGEAIVVTSASYGVGNGSAGTLVQTMLTDPTCSYWYDTAWTDKGLETQFHPFPIGIPMPVVTAEAVSVSSGSSAITITGYLIPAGQLPAAPPATKIPAAALHPTR
ncbi:MAG: hypothetical protein QOI51_483, partial [Nocardioidaceae bacterium]|nr:hypothetical protein [Nocardioidaceae bacterium]